MSKSCATFTSGLMIFSFAVRQALVPVPEVIPQSYQPQQGLPQHTGYAQQQVVHEQPAVRQGFQNNSFDGFRESQTMRDPDFGRVVQSNSFEGRERSEMRRVDFGREEPRRPFPQVGQNVVEFSSVPEPEEGPFNDPFKQNQDARPRPQVPQPPRIGQFRRPDQEEPRQLQGFRQPFRAAERFGQNQGPTNSGSGSDDVVVIGELKAGLNLPAPSPVRSIQDRLGVNPFATRQIPKAVVTAPANEPSKGRDEFEQLGSRNPTGPQPSQNFRSFGQKRPMDKPIPGAEQGLWKSGAGQATGPKMTAERLSARATYDPDQILDWETDRPSRPQPEFGAGELEVLPILVDFQYLLQNLTRSSEVMPNFKSLCLFMG